MRKLGLVGIVVGVFLLLMGLNVWSWSTIPDVCGPFENKSCVEDLNRKIALYFILGFIILIVSFWYTFKKPKKKL